MKILILKKCFMGMRNKALLLIILLTLSAGCSNILREVRVTAPISKSYFTIEDISKGLPIEGLFRQNIALYDVNDDGFLDIITPTPRKAEGEDRRPFIFIWNQETSEWREADYKFPTIEGYNYGGVAVGDINRDGLFDMALANHINRIIILLNDGNKGFREMPFSPEKPFYSRTIKLIDMNNDGWLDIVALSEAPFVQGYIPPGFMIAINKEGKGWDISFIEKSLNIHGSTFQVGDYNGDKEKDIGLAPLTLKGEDKKLIFLGRGEKYEEYVDGSRLLDNETLTFISTSGDYDGNGVDEIVYLVSSGLGEESRVYLIAFKWVNDNLKDISNGLTTKERPLVFTSNDFDNDGKDELLLLSKAGFHIFKYSDNIWREIFSKEMDYDKDIRGVYDVTSGRLNDDSFLIVYNRGRENSEIHGIKGYVMKWQKD